MTAPRMTRRRLEALLHALSRATDEWEAELLDAESGEDATEEKRIARQLADLREARRAVVAKWGTP